MAAGKENGVEILGPDLRQLRRRAQRFDSLGVRLEALGGCSLGPRLIALRIERWLSA